MDLQPSLQSLLERYDEALHTRGDSAPGALWPNETDRATRYAVMLDVIDDHDEESITVCDFACGTGDLLSHIRRSGMKNVSYIGADPSEAALDYARKKFPGEKFVRIDLLPTDEQIAQLSCDYLICNGLFTTKFDMSNEEMLAFLSATVRRLWPQVRRGIAFNVMSSVVQWRRDDLFHLSMDDAARLMHDIAGRRIVIRADYGLYEYTIYARRPRALLPADRAVKVLQPQLPTTKHLLQYLPRIDQTRIYTNHGPLAMEFAARVSALLNIPAKSVVTASSGSAALAGAILGAAGRAKSERPLAIIPAFTFVATALAVEQCGYQPYLIDIDPDTWMLEPDTVLRSAALDRAGVVVPVAPLGRLVQQGRWREFQRQSGIPVVIDAAASFDLFDRETAFDLPTVVSFHATKAFGTGEGGAILTPEEKTAEKIVQALNFGFHETRETRMAGINGKMSEYHAAVGLAEMDGWAGKIAGLRRTADLYTREAGRAGISERLFTTPSVSACYVLFRAADLQESLSRQESLRAAEIDFRLWYGRGIHRHEYFFGAPREGLEITEALADTLIGLPVSASLSAETIKRIVNAVAS